MRETEDVRDGFDPTKSSTWTDEEKAVYETGYAEGSRSVAEDLGVADDRALAGIMRRFLANDDCGYVLFAPEPVIGTPFLVIDSRINLTADEIEALQRTHVDA